MRTKRLTGSALDALAHRDYERRPNKARAIGITHVNMRQELNTMLVEGFQSAPRIDLGDLQLNAERDLPLA